MYYKFLDYEELLVFVDCGVPFGQKRYDISAAWDHKMDRDEVMY